MANQRDWQRLERDASRTHRGDAGSIVRLEALLSS